MDEGTARQRRAEARGVGESIKYGRLPGDATRVHRMAYGAEAFVLEPYGLTEQMTKRRPGGCDWRVVRRGKPAVCGEIKWTPYASGSLLVSREQLARHTCLVYVLVTGEPDKGVPYAVAGWAWGHRVAAAPDSPKSTVASAGLAQAQLHPPGSLPLLMAATFGATL